jgi:hypothetical protein
MGKAEENNDSGRLGGVFLVLVMINKMLAVSKNASEVSKLCRYMPLGKASLF